MLTATQIEKLADGFGNEVEVHSVTRSKSDGLIVHYTRIWYETFYKVRAHLEERVAFFDSTGRFRSNMFAE